MSSIWLYGQHHFAWTTFSNDSMARGTFFSTTYYICVSSNVCVLCFMTIFLLVLENVVCYAWALVIILAARAAISSRILTNLAHLRSWHNLEGPRHKRESARSGSASQRNYASQKEIFAVAGACASHRSQIVHARRSVGDHVSASRTVSSVTYPSFQGIVMTRKSLLRTANCGGSI